MNIEITPQREPGRSPRSGSRFRRDRPVTRIRRLAAKASLGASSGFRPGSPGSDGPEEVYAELVFQEVSRRRVRHGQRSHQQDQSRVAAARPRPGAEDRVSLNLRAPFELAHHQPRPHVGFPGWRRSQSLGRAGRRIDQHIQRPASRLGPVETSCRRLRHGERPGLPRRPRRRRPAEQEVIPAGARRRLWQFPESKP